MTIPSITLTSGWLARDVAAAVDSVRFASGTPVHWRTGSGVVLAICDGWAWVRTALGGFASVPISWLEVAA